MPLPKLIEARAKEVGVARKTISNVRGALRKLGYMHACLIPLH